MILIKTPKFFRFKKDKGIKSRYLITAEIKFDAAHRLSDYKGKCERIHGHTYRVLITVESSKLNDWGAVLDFGDLKKLLKTYVDDKYDHKLILKSGNIKNEVIGKALQHNWIVWMNGNPTAENMARDIYKDLVPTFNVDKFKEVKLIEVTVYETTTNKATYAETENK